MASVDRVSCDGSERREDTYAGLLELAGGLAHEIRNPLNYVKSAIESIRRDAVRLSQPREAPLTFDPGELETMLPRMQKMFETADSGVRRIAATVDLMMRYSREGYTRAAQPYDVYAAVKDVIALLRPTTGFEFEVATELEGDGRIECVPEEFNQVLSVQRGETVKAYFVERGIAADRITVVGYGETQPRDTNDTIEGRRLNRRVEIRAIGG